MLGKFVNFGSGKQGFVVGVSADLSSLLVCQFEHIAISDRGKMNLVAYSDLTIFNTDLLKQFSEDGTEIEIEERAEFIIDLITFINQFDLRDSVSIFVKTQLGIL